MNPSSDRLDGAIVQDTGAGPFQATIDSGGLRFLADEPVAAGGLGSGPSPYQLLAAALGACTTMTVRLYAARKGWPVEHVRTEVGHVRDPARTPADGFVRRITIVGDIDAEQHARLIDIADHCPVHRTLTAGARIDTVANGLSAAAGPATDHAADMEALIAVGRRSFDFTE